MVQAAKLIVAVVQKLLQLFINPYPFKTTQKQHNSFCQEEKTFFETLMIR